MTYWQGQLDTLLQPLINPYPMGEEGGMLVKTHQWNCQVTGPSAQLLLQIIEGVQILDVNRVNR